MSPLQIGILLHYYARSDDYRDGDFSAPAVEEAISNFFNVTEMLQRAHNFTQTYRLTERGEAFVNHILSLQLPVKTWAMPKEKENE